jgi:hypothetical protein
VNYHLRPEWSELLRWAKERQDFETLSPAAWVAKLEQLEEKGSQHPALQLLEHWHRAYKSTGDAPAGRKTFSVQRSIERLPALRTVGPVDEAYFERLWKWIQEAV